MNATANNRLGKSAEKRNGIINMTSLLAKAVLSRLTPEAFAAFLFELFNEDQNEPFNLLPQAGKNVYVQPILDSYGGSLDRVFVLHYLPFALFSPPTVSLTHDPRLISTLRRVRNIYKRRLGQWGMVSPCTIPATKLQVLSFLTNINGLSRTDYENFVIPQYSTLARKLRLRKPRIFVGSYDSFVDLSLSGTVRALTNLLTQHSDGVRIVLNAEQFAVQRFSAESVLTAGVPGTRPQPYEPIYLSPTSPLDNLLLEFEYLLNSAPHEKELERFLVTHFRALFGAKYDRIETQIWLRFPHLDITEHNRRTDLFMRNAVTNDWELIELKRVDAPLISTYRDVPMLSHEVLGAVQQLRNYARVLSQHEVREKLARRGIEYYEPELCVVVGREPNIPLGQWRWLMSQYSKDVRITTYGHLLDELQIRSADRVSAQSV